MTRTAPGWASFKRSLSIRHLVIGLGAAALIGLCTLIGIANLFRSRDPDFVARFAPFDGQARAVAAEQAMTSPTFGPAKADDVERLARQALARDPTSVSAWRSLAAVREVQGRKPAATALFRFSERLSRRDTITQLWLIEERVGANDVPGALRHYDIALRTSTRTGSFLLPILAAATSESAVVRPLVAILRTRPAWRNDFLYELSQRAPSARNLVAIVEGIGGQRDLPSSTMILMTDRLVSQGEYDSAWRLYALERPAQARETPLRDPGFEASGLGYSFEWHFEDAGNLGAQPVAVGASSTGIALAVRAEGGESGVVARQLLRLPAGVYRISAKSGTLPDVGPARMNWALYCAGSSPENPDHAEASSGGPLLPPATAEVPAAGCAAQWLELRVRAGAETEQAGGWVDDVDVRRVR